jgi:hypothetical protein
MQTDAGGLDAVLECALFDHPLRQPEKCYKNIGKF